MEAANQTGAHAQARFRYYTLRFKIRAHDTRAAYSVTRMTPANDDDLTHEVRQNIKCCCCQSESVKNASETKQALKIGTDKYKSGLLFLFDAS